MSAPSQRIQSLEDSPIRKLTPYAEAAAARGIKIHHLNIGQPDLHTPVKFFEAICNAKPKILSYTKSEGLDEYREKLTKYYDLFEMSVSRDDILVTIGGSEAILFSFLITCEPGDEVIVIEPTYANYRSFAKMAGVTLVPVTSHIEDNFKLPKISEFENKITKRTKAILLCNPNNPTGHLLLDSEQQEISELAKKHELFVIADEVYKELCFNGVKFRSMLSFDPTGERTIIIDSISKKHSACGARIGSLITKNKQLMQSAVKLARSRLSAPLLEQIGAMALIDSNKDEIRSIRDEYKNRRDVILEGLKLIPGVKTTPIKGAIYAMAQLPIDDSEDFAKWLLTDFEDHGETIMVAPGNGFYLTPDLGKNEIRIAFVLEKQTLIRAMVLLEKALQLYLNN